MAICFHRWHLTTSVLKPMVKYWYHTTRIKFLLPIINFLTPIFAPPNGDKRFILS